MFTRSQALQRAAIKDTIPLLQEVLDAAGLGISDVDHVIPHQTSARAIRKGMGEVTRALGGEPRSPAVVTVDQFGNTASTTGYAKTRALPSRRLRRRSCRPRRFSENTAWVSTTST